MNFEPETTYIVLSRTYYDNYSNGNAEARHPFTDNSAKGYEDTYNTNVKGMVTCTATRILDGNYTDNDESRFLWTVTYYDKYYRVLQTVTDNAMGGYDRITNKYRFSGEVTESYQEHNNGTTTETIRKWYEYDHAGRLQKTKQQIGSGAIVEISTNQYDEIGQLQNKKLHNNVTPLQIIDYKYNMRGWLTHINTPETVDQNYRLFGMQLLYNSPTPHLNAPAQYNGNISAMRWKTYNGDTGSEENYIRGYGFRYDELNRIKQANYGGIQHDTWAYDYKDCFTVSGIEYDSNGNIHALNRMGATSTDNFEMIDGLTYSYKGNKLLAVEDKYNPIAKRGDFVDGIHQTEEYKYDGNGNMTEDWNKGLIVEYNLLNLPDKISKTGISGSEEMHNIYDAAGNKLTKKIVIDGNTTTTENYCGNFIYKNGTLDYIVFDEGRITNNSGTLRYEYFLKDHLGNTRVVVSPDENSDGKPEISQTAHYYPFGMNFQRPTNNHNRRLYNGKELQTELDIDWYDYGARFYDASIARFVSVDPHAENYYSHTPYNYVGGNPIILTDPNGMDWFYNEYTGDVFYNQGFSKGAEEYMEHGWVHMGENGMFESNGGNGLYDTYNTDSEVLNFAKAMYGAEVETSYNYETIDHPAGPREAVKSSNTTAYLDGDNAKKLMGSYGYSFRPKVYKYHSIVKDYQLPEGTSQYNIGPGDVGRIEQVITNQYVHKDWNKTTKTLREYRDAFVDEHRASAPPYTISHKYEFRMDVYAQKRSLASVPIPTKNLDWKAFYSFYIESIFNLLK